MNEMRARLVVSADASQAVTGMAQAAAAIDDVERASRRLGDGLTKTGASSRTAVRDLVEATTGVGRSMTSAASSADVFSQALAEQDQRYKALRASIDPAWRAERQFVAAQDELNRSLRLGSVEADEHAQMMRRLQAQYERARTAAVAFDAAQDAVGGSSGAMRGQVQNAAFQIGDLATQIGGGTAASVALAQQLPQLLGGLGMFGAVAGAAVAIGVPLASAFLGAGDAAGEAEKRLTELERATAAMTDAAADTVAIEALRRQYRGLADEVQRAGDAMVLMTSIRARTDAIGAAQSLGAGFEGLNIVVPDIDASDMGASVGRDQLILRQRQAMEELQAQTGATAQQVDQLRMALNRTNSSNSLDAVVKDAENLLAVIADLYVEATDEQRRFLDGWASQTSAVLQSARQQMDAAARDRQRLLDSYDTNSQKLVELGADLRKAEDERAKAAAAGLQDEVAMWDRVAAAIRTNIYETRALASESDTLFERLAKGAQSFLGQAGTWAKGFTSPEGFEARYIEERARGAGSQNEEAVRAASAAAEQLGIAAKDLLAVMSFESGIDPSRYGGKNGEYLGLIQFSPENQRRYGVNEDQSISQQMSAVVRYLKDTGVKPGMGIEHVYAAILAGDARRINASDRKSGGIVDNVYADTRGTKFAPHINRASGLLGAYPDVVRSEEERSAQQKRLDDERTREAKRQADERDREGKRRADQDARLRDSVTGELDKLSPSYDRAVAAADRWKAEALAGLDATKAGYAEFAADIEAIYQQRLTKAREDDLARQEGWAAGIERGFADLEENALNWATVSEDLITGWAKGGEDAFVSFVTTGKASMADLVDFTLEQLARLAWQQAIQPGLNGLMNSAAGALGNWLGNGTGGAGDPLGDALRDAGVTLPTAHTGETGVMRTYSAGNRRRADERLAMLREGERVMTPRMLENAGTLVSSLAGLATGGGNQPVFDNRPVVQVINNSSAPVDGQVRETRDERGGRQYQLVLSDAVAGALTVPGGRASRTLQQRFGVQKQGPRR